MSNVTDSCTLNVNKLVEVWFYEHTTKFDDYNDRKVPIICSWANFNQGKKYDAGLLLRSVKEKEVCDVVM